MCAVNIRNYIYFGKANLGQKGRPKCIVHHIPKKEQTEKKVMKFKQTKKFIPLKRKSNDRFDFIL